MSLSVCGEVDGCGRMGCFLLILCIVATIVTAKPAEDFTSLENSQDNGDPWTRNLLPSLPEDGGGSPWLPFLPLGFHRPVLPEIQPVPDMDELPANYDNSTHEVKVVNGSRVEVNTTTTKHTGTDFTSFVHQQAVHIRPYHGEGGNKGTLRASRSADHSPPTSDRGAAYVRQEPDSTDSDEDKVVNPPDLSSDTRVNHVHPDRQGITLIDPDAEIFDLGLVIKEAEMHDKDD